MAAGHKRADGFERTKLARLLKPERWWGVGVRKRHDSRRARGHRGTRRIAFRRHTIHSVFRGPRRQESQNLVAEAEASLHRTLHCVTLRSATSLRKPRPICAAANGILPALKSSSRLTVEQELHQNTHTTTRGTTHNTQRRAVITQTTMSTPATQRDNSTDPPKRARQHAAAAAASSPRAPGPSPPSSSSRFGERRGSNRPRARRARTTPREGNTKDSGGGIDGFFGRGNEGFGRGGRRIRKGETKDSGGARRRRADAHAPEVDEEALRRLGPQVADERACRA